MKWSHAEEVDGGLAGPLGEPRDEEELDRLVRALRTLADWPATAGNYDMREFARQVVAAQ